MKKVTFKFIVICLVALYATFAENNFTIHTDSVQWKISQYLVGLHSVYSGEPDEFYADGSYAQWVKDIGVSTMRYPGGGVVKYWDWEKPTGILNEDSWSPTWNDANYQPEKNWLSLDEYLDFVDKTGIAPLLGVNITSGHLYNRVQDGIDRAVRMVQHVKDRGHSGAFWYLGNEGSLLDDWEQEANYIVQYVKAMRKVDPAIITMFNKNNLTPDYLKKYLAIAGDYIDIAETHGKWPYGGDPSNEPPGTEKEWKVEKPLRDRKNHNRAWREEVQPLMEAAVEAGYPDLKIANNEYGKGKEHNSIGFDRYTSGLLVVDMLQEMFIGNWYMSCYWSNIRADLYGMASKKENYRLNPVSIGFELLGKAQGGDMLKLVDGGGQSVYGFAAKKGSEVLLYLINKSDDSQNTTISVEGMGDSVHFIEGKRMEHTPDLWGKKSDFTVSENGAGSFEAVLPALSYSRFAFSKNATGTIWKELNTQETRIEMKSYLFGKKILISGGQTVRGVRLFNVSGKTCKQAFNQRYLDVSDVNPGLYFIRLIFRDGSCVSRKILIR
jgi:hypothetical protein